MTGEATGKSLQGETGSGRLAGRVAIVTGAGRGIGRAIALALGDEGAAVAVVSRTPGEAGETASSIRDRGKRALAIVADVSDWQSVQEMVERTVGEIGGVHILVNNAGVQGPIGPLADNDPAEWVRALQVNLVGTFYCCKAVLPHMMRSRSGRIINLSGGGGTSPRPFFSAYAAGKAAIVRLTETLAEEVKDFNVQVNAIAPGAVNTRILEEVLAAGPVAGEKAQAEAQRQLETGGASPALAAALATFLASDESDGLTGKLVAALYDGWQTWDGERIAELMSAPWLTIRRLDPLTLSLFASKIGHEAG